MSWLRGEPSVQAAWVHLDFVVARTGKCPPTIFCSQTSHSSLHSKLFDNITNGINVKAVINRNYFIEYIIYFPIISLFFFHDKVSESCFTGQLPGIGTGFILASFQMCKVQRQSPLTNQG